MTQVIDGEQGNAVLDGEFECPDCGNDTLSLSLFVSLFLTINHTFMTQVMDGEQGNAVLDGEFECPDCGNDTSLSLSFSLCLSLSLSLSFPLSD